MESDGQRIEVFRTPRRWEWRLRAVADLIGGALFLSFDLRYPSAAAAIFSGLCFGAAVVWFVVADRARVEVLSTGLMRWRIIRGRFWPWSEIQGAYPGTGLSRFGAGPAPELLLASGRRIRLDEFKEPWRIRGRKSQPPPEATELVEAVNLRTGPPPPAPPLAPPVRASFLPIALVVVVSFIIALILIGAISVAVASGPVTVNPSTLPPGHRYDVYDTGNGRELDEVSCPSPINSLDSHDPPCRDHARSAMIGIAVVVVISLVVLGLEGWYLVRRRRRRRAKAVALVGADPASPATS